MFTKDERDKVTEYFGKIPEELTAEEFEQKHRELRAKYHPDKFEKYSDDVVRMLASEKFKEIELLADKIQKYFLAKKNFETTERKDGENQPKYAYNELKIEIVTKEKDLKYYLFGTHYRWLERGDKYKIKGTNASIIIDANYANRSIGFNESIKMYLTFSETDSLEIIMGWLFHQISGYSTLVILEGKPVKVDFEELLSAVKSKTILRLRDGH